MRSCNRAGSEAFFRARDNLLCGNWLIVLPWNILNLYSAGWAFDEIISCVLRVVKISFPAPSHLRLEATEPRHDQLLTGVTSMQLSAWKAHYEINSLSVDGRNQHHTTSY